MHKHLLAVLVNRLVAVPLMKLYLVQHAESKRKDEDPARPLSEKGWKDIRKVAAYAEKCLHIQVKEIFHSDKLRARQTAQALADHLHPKKGVQFAEGLNPLADPKVWKTLLAETTEDTLIVGHLPHLGKLAGQLLTGDDNGEVVAFKNGCIICLEKNESGQWTVQWMITPEIVPQTNGAALNFEATMESAREILEEAATIAEKKIEGTLQ